MNVEIGTSAKQLLFWVYLYWIFGIGSLQCGRSGSYLKKTLFSLYILWTFIPRLMYLASTPGVLTVEFVPQSWILPLIVLKKILYPKYGGFSQLCAREERRLSGLAALGRPIPRDGHLTLAHVPRPFSFSQLIHTQSQILMVGGILLGLLGFALFFTFFRGLDLQVWN